MAYIASTDIKDELIYNIVASDTSYLDRADNALKDLANSKGLAVAEIESTPLPFLVKEWLKAYVGWEVCFNNSGLYDKLIQNNDVAIDVYGNKLELYKKTLEGLSQKLTKDVISGTADTPEEYSAIFSKVYRA
jgi:hypothetical protein